MAAREETGIVTAPAIVPHAVLRRRMTQRHWGESLPVAVACFLTSHGRFLLDRRRRSVTANAVSEVSVSNLCPAFCRSNLFWIFGNPIILAK